jgi:phosphatidylglycerophosphate synthase
MVSEPGRLGGGLPEGSRGRRNDRRYRGLKVERELLLDTLANIGGLFLATIVIALILSLRYPLGWEFVATVAVSLAFIFVLVIYGLPDHPHQRFGYANMVTAVRASIVTMTGAVVLCFEDLAMTDPLLWVLVFAVLLALSLDGVDGLLARRYGQESPFGARFDMEVDALLILILSVAAMLLGKAGPWVLFIGLMRYGFVAAGWVMPSLNGELPPSFRRKLVCVVQIGALCMILVPPITAPYSEIIAAVALMALAYSFAVDVLYLLRQSAAS